MEEQIDLRGLKCPLPALLARRALARRAAGEIVLILSSDPLAVVDIPHMCGQEGHRIEAVTRGHDHDIFRVRRGP